MKDSGDNPFYDYRGQLALNIRTDYILVTKEIFPTTIETLDMCIVDHTMHQPTNELRVIPTTHYVTKTYIPGRTARWKLHKGPLDNADTTRLPRNLQELIKHAEQHIPSRILLLTSSDVELFFRVPPPRRITVELLQEAQGEEGFPQFAMNKLPPEFYAGLKKLGFYEYHPVSGGEPFECDEEKLLETPTRPTVH